MNTDRTILNGLLSKRYVLHDTIDGSNLRLQLYRKNYLLAQKDGDQAEMIIFERLFRNELANREHHLENLERTNREIEEITGRLLKLPARAAFRGRKKKTKKVA